MNKEDNGILLAKMHEFMRMVHDTNTMDAEHPGPRPERDFDEHRRRFDCPDDWRYGRFNDMHGDSPSPDAPHHGHAHDAHGDFHHGHGAPHSHFGDLHGHTAHPQPEFAQCDSDRPASFAHDRNCHECAHPCARGMESAPHADADSCDNPNPLARRGAPTGDFREHHRGSPMGRERILSIIGESESISQQRIAECVHIRPQSLSELLCKLEADGYITRVKNELDKRETLVSLTESGRTRAQQFESARAQKLDSIFAPLTPEERATLLELLNKLTSPHSVSPLD